MENIKEKIKEGLATTNLINRYVDLRHIHEIEYKIDSELVNGKDEIFIYLFLMFPSGYHTKKYEITDSGQFMQDYKKLIEQYKECNINSNVNSIYPFPM